MNAKVGSREASLMKFRTEYRSTMRNGKAAFEQAEERKLHQKGDEMKKLIVMESQDGDFRLTDNSFCHSDETDLLMYAEFASDGTTSQVALKKLAR